MGKFEKGHPGGPGRPKKSDEQKRFERRCREIADTLGIDRLVYWLKSTNSAASLAALKEINERGFGKSVAFEVLDAEITGPAGSSVEDLAGEVADLLGERAAKGGQMDSEGQVDG
jgi:hypothetical protein